MENIADHQSHGHASLPVPEGHPPWITDRLGEERGLHSTKDADREHVAVYSVFSLLINQINSL